MRLHVSPAVGRDLREIGDYIAKHNSVRALTFVEELEDAILGLADNPFLFQLRPEYGAETRVLSHGRYLILFRVAQDTVFVDRVMQGARNVEQVR